jgi:two-component system sensor histidine kinase KdpD
MTHGRHETERLAEGSRRCPCVRPSTAGSVLQEFDPDAALRRRPGPPARRRARAHERPGSRHARRWQDVLELVEAGVDVLTTLNVQHVESLNDLVARITQVRVRETVPDSILERADEIELVDLSPEDLLQRLRRGRSTSPSRPSARCRASSARGT